VLSNLKWQKAALLLNLAGTIILFYSFQATSSDFKLVVAPYVPPPPRVLPNGQILPNRFPSYGTKQYALCVNNYTLIASDASSSIMMGHAGCPNWENARPAAVVNIEHPTFEGIGFALLIIGFSLQYFSVPHPATISQLRKELKIAQQKEKSKSQT
jgi:hypothetical protein